MEIVSRVKYNADERAALLMPENAIRQQDNIEERRFI